MEILSLTAEAFRNLVSGRIELHPRVNLISGDNGQGKTNLLEALALVSGRPSFRTSDLRVVRAEGAARSFISVRMRPQAGADRVVGADRVIGVELADGVRNHHADGRKITRLEATRAVPAVFLTAADLQRLTGAPAARRNAVDRAASILDASHTKALQAYERARISKSRLLSAGRFDPDELAIYELAMLAAGSELAAGRRSAAVKLEEELVVAAHDLKSPYRDVRLALSSDLPPAGSKDELRAAFSRLVDERRREERRAGRCLVGPHRDDVVLSAGTTPLSERASSGETRTLLLAWTLAELRLLLAARGTAPAFAFDDFDSEWDPEVLSTFAEALPESGQVFLTSARPDAVRSLPLPSGAIFRMEKGKLTRVGILGAGRASERKAVGEPERAAG